MVIFRSYLSNHDATMGHMWRFGADSFKLDCQTSATSGASEIGRCTDDALRIVSAGDVGDGSKLIGEVGLDTSSESS